MTTTEHCQVVTKPAARAAITFGALLAIVAATSITTRAQSEPSLGDVARQSRKQRPTGTGRTSTPAAADANRLAAELEQEQEMAGAVPDGFQWYSGEGYGMSVPAPFSVEGRDEVGVLLSTAEVTGITTKVIAGSPIPITGTPGELEFQELVRRYWGSYGAITCAKPKEGVRGHECTVSGNVLGNQFGGTARFIEGDRRIIPVICFATSLVNYKLDYSIRRRTREETDNLRDEGLRNMRRREEAFASNQLCSAVLDSIRLKEDSAQPRGTAVRAATRTASLSPTPYHEVSSSSTSLGEVARQTKVETSQQKSRVSVEAEDTINAAPAGFRVYSSLRCVQECWQESFFLPDSARHVKGGNSENVYVVTRDGTTSVVIYFGETRVSNGYSDYGTAQTVARSWIHAQLDWKTPVVHLNGTVNGHPVERLRSRLTASMNAWTEEDVTVEGDGINFNIGCIAPEDQFPDSESLCSTVWESWRVHR
jgi:hypothetical protein